MSRLIQLKKHFRLRKKQKSAAPALKKSPQKRGLCLKLYTVTPKKPNSALRKVAKIKLSNKRLIVSYIPGEGHNLQKFSSVLVRGGHIKDVPGVNYHLIRGKFDLFGVQGRKSSRSKYGTKKTYK